MCHLVWSLSQKPSQLICCNFCINDATNPHHQVGVCLNHFSIWPSCGSQQMCIPILSGLSVMVSVFFLCVKLAGPREGRTQHVLPFAQSCNQRSTQCKVQVSLKGLLSSSLALISSPSCHWAFGVSIRTTSLFPILRNLQMTRGANYYAQ